MVIGFEYVCETCETTSVVRFTSEAEAEHLVTVHEGLLHGGRPSCRIRAVYAVPEQAPPGIPVEVEVETLAEFHAALDAAPDVIMLDEFSHAQMREAVARRNAAQSPSKLEASGGVDLAGIRAVAETGVDYSSVGSLTKHLHAIDLSLRFQID